MKRGTEPFRRPPKRLEVFNFNDVLAQMQHSGSIIYFVKSLPKTAIQTLKTQKTAILTLPTQFIRDNGEKIEQSWVILRAHSPRGRSARSVIVQLNVSARSPGVGKIRIGGGLYAAIAGNRLREGDSLIFVPQEDARLGFEVYMFRDSREFPLFPNEGDNASTDEENRINNNQSSLAFPLHHGSEHKKATFTSDIMEGEAIPLQYAYHLRPHPGFYKELTVTSIGQPHLNSSGRFEFPVDFVKYHGKHVQTSVKFKGIHEDSSIRVFSCRKRWSKNRLRVWLLACEWRQFVMDNALKAGHELQFSLVADSYFVVRKV